MTIRKSAGCYVVAFGGRFVEIERLGPREWRVEWGSVVSEAQDAMREAAK